MKCEGCPPKFSADFPKSFQRCRGRRSRRNPGNILELHAIAHRIKPTILDGIQLDYVHRLTSNKFITANWTLSHNIPSGLRFGGIYIGGRDGEIMQTPIIQADINPSNLSTNISFLYHPFRCLRLETEMQKASKESQLQTQTCIELCTNSSTLTANLYDVRRDTGRGTLSFLKAVTDHVALGGELLLEWTEPNSFMTDVALAGRYKRHSYSVAATVSRQGIDVSYWQRIHARIQMASFWAWHRKTDNSVGTICYQWEFQNAVVRGMFDSTSSVGFMYSRYLSHLPLCMDLGLLIGLNTHRFVFGLKFILNPCGLQRGP